MAKKKKPNFITYSNNVDEVIVCNPRSHKSTLKLFFEEGERNLDDYERRDIYCRYALISTGIRVEG